MSEFGYLFELVGGPFDGCKDLAVILEHDAELPKQIYVGVCRGRGMCEAPDCERRGRHVQWWEDLDGLPVETFVYTRENVDSYPEWRVGTATYVFGGLPESRGLTEFVDTEAERELLTPVGCGFVWGATDRELVLARSGDSVTLPPVTVTLSASAHRRIRHREET